MSVLSSEFMPEVEAAKLLGVSIEATRKWRVRRVGPPFVKAGKRVLYRVEAVRAWLLERERDPTKARRG